MSDNRAALEEDARAETTRGADDDGSSWIKRDNGNHHELMVEQPKRRAEGFLKRRRLTLKG